MLQAFLPGPTEPMPMIPGGFQAEATPEEGAGVAEVSLGVDPGEG